MYSCGRFEIALPKQASSGKQIISVGWKQSRQPLGIFLVPFQHFSFLHSTLGISILNER